MFKEIEASQRKFAERVVSWDLDNNVSRRMAYNHYFGQGGRARRRPDQGLDPPRHHPAPPDGVFFPARQADDRLGPA